MLESATKCTGAEAAEPEDEFVCAVCGAVYPVSRLFMLDTVELCVDCYEREVVTCASCGTRILSDDNAGNRYTPLCESCYERYYTTCEGCGRIVSNEYASYDEDEGYAYCEQCYHERHIGALHEYGYKPKPIFYGEGSIYYGVELEIDDGGRSSANAQKLLDTANSEQEHIYIKTDGSLDDGLEIVTHPCTLDYHMNCFPWQSILQKAVSLGYLSHSTPTCGLHVHVNRNAFSTDPDIQDECIGRIIFFMEKHWDELLRFSRRTESQMSRWSARYGLKSTPKESIDHAKQYTSVRYTALNLCNRSTIEFRIFRGSLKYSTLIAAIQLVNEICIAAVRLSDDEMAKLSWTGFVEKIQASELITYLKERRLYINEPLEPVGEEL